MASKESFVKLHQCPFTVRGTYFAFYLSDVAEHDFGQAELWLGTERGIVPFIQRNKLIKLLPVWKGEIIPFAITTTPYELIMETLHGTIRITIPEKGLIRISSEGEVGLLLEGDMKRYDALHENIRYMYDDTWQIFYSMILNLLLVPVVGKLDVDAPWNWRLTITEYIRATFTPDESGHMEIALEEFIDREGTRRETYPTYEESLAAVQESFDSFLAKIPEFKVPELEAVRKKAAWTTWNHLLEPDCRVLKHQMIAMMHIYMDHCSGWQQCTHAIDLAEDPELSYELLCNVYDYQSEDGQLPDVVNDMWPQMKAGKPPLQGFAILWLLDHKDIEHTYTKEQFENLYFPVVRQLEWWEEHRVRPGKILPFFGNPDESGWDDSPMYRESCQMITPDVVSYIILLYEAASRMAQILGRSDEAKALMDKSKAMLDEMIKKMWSGERFEALFPDTEEMFHSESATSYQSLILGKRLPQEIIDKMAADLSEEDKFLTPYGVASLPLDSSIMDVLTGWMAGPINAPLDFQIIIGLAECGKKELSKEIALRYCKNIAKTGFYHIVNPYSGHGADKGRDGVLHQHWTSWCSGTFLRLAADYCD